jgi:hypothetical protein
MDKPRRRRDMQMVQAEAGKAGGLHMKWLWWLTGGRPMKYLGCAFIDRVTHKEVNYYRDRLGRGWLATNCWASFRVENGYASNLGRAK